MAFSTLTPQGVAIQTDALHNYATKFGGGKEMVEWLINLVAIFANPGLDLSNYCADVDDILGDAYKCLLRYLPPKAAKSKE